MALNKNEDITNQLIAARETDRTNQHRDFIHNTASNSVNSALASFSQDPLFVSSSKMIYEWKNNEPFGGTDEEAVLFGADYMSDINDIFYQGDTTFAESPGLKQLEELAEWETGTSAQKKAFAYLLNTWQDNDPIVAGINLIQSSASRDANINSASLVNRNSEQNSVRDGTRAFVNNMVLDDLMDGMDEETLKSITNANNIAADNLKGGAGSDELREQVAEFYPGLIKKLWRILGGGARDAVQGAFDLGADIDGVKPLGKIAWGYGNGLEWVTPDDPRYNDIKIELPDIAHGGGGGEEFLRSITHFMTMFASGGGLIRIGGSGYLKAADITTDMGAGMMADATFDPELGGIATMLREFNVDNAVVNFLDSRVGEDATAKERLMSRMKLAIGEGAPLGLAMYGLIDGLSAIKRNGLSWKVKELINTGKTALDDWTPRPGELRSGVGPSGDAVYRSPTPLSFPEDATNARVQRIVKRNVAAASGKDIPGGPKNERTVIKAPDGSGLPDFVVGDITFDDWITRVETMMSPDDIASASKWYSTVRGEFLKYADSPEEADTLMRAWLVANQNTSVDTALANALLQREQVTRGTPVGELISGGLPNPSSAARAVLLDEDIQAGVGQKISDFVDSAEGVPVRSWMGGDDRGGKPFVVDVHTGRDTGFVDQALINRLRQAGYDEDQLTKLKTDFENAPGETQYENRSLFGQSLTDHLNDVKWQGRSDWKPHEIQAIGWINMINNFSTGGAVDVKDALTQNLRRISFEIAPGDGSPWATKYGERFSALDSDQQYQLTQEVSDRAFEMAQDISGIDLRGLVHGTGGWENFQNPSTVLQSLSSTRTAEIAANTLGLLLNRTEVWVNSLKATTKNPKAFAVDFIEDGSENLASNEGLQSIWQTIMDADSTGLIVGYQPIKTIDGNVGIRVLIDKGGVKRKEALQAVVKGEIKQALEELDYDVLIDFSEARIIKASNDWAEVPNGQSYNKRLEELGVGRTTADWDSLRSELEEIIESNLKGYERSSKIQAAGLAATVPLAADASVDLERLALAESNNDPTAVSEDGARGHIQMMPKTYAGLEAEAAEFGVKYPAELKGVSMDEAVENPELLELAGETYLEVLKLQLQNLDIPVDTQNLIGAWNMGADGYFKALATGNFPEETINLWHRYGIEGHPTGFDVLDEGKPKNWKRYIELSSQADQQRRLENAGIDMSILE